MTLSIAAMAKLRPVPVSTQLKALRVRAGVTMKATALACGYKNSSGYQRYEDATIYKKEYLPVELAEKLSTLLAGKGSPPITVSEVMALAGVQIGSKARRRQIPVVGFVGAGSMIYPIDTYDKGAGLDQVESPWESLRPDAVAVRVRGDSMATGYFDGDLIFYDTQFTDFIHLIGKECVIALRDGRRFIKILRRTAEGFWVLFSNNADPIFNVEIEWAAPVRVIQRAA